MISNQLKDYDRIFKLPFIVSSTIISVIVTITGLSQFPDAIEKYFPPLYDHLKLNILPISLTMSATINVVFLISALLGFLYAKNNLKTTENKENKDVTVVDVKNVDVISPSSEGSFYMEYFSNLAAAAALHSNEIKIVLTYHTPGKPFVNLAASGIRERITNTSKSLDGIFIIPSDTTDQTKKFIKENQSKTIVLDVCPCDEEKGFYFVGGDEEVGGEVAANIAIDYFNILKKEEQENFKNKKIGFLKGSDIIYENQRVKSFIKHISEFFQQKITINQIGHTFKYQRREVARHFSRDIKINELLRYSVIFASNDDMALGIRDGYTKLINNKQIDEKDQQKLPKIIGYDGTMLIRQYIQLRDSFILGSVDVKIEQQAKIAVESMYKLLTALEEKKTKKETKIEKIDKIIIPARCDNPLFFWQNN